MDFRTNVSITKENFNLSVGDSIVMLGSCFTENIGSKLCDLKFDCDVNPFGVLYNPISICQAIECLLEGPDFKFENYLFEKNGLWNSWLHSGLFSAASREQCIENILKRHTTCANSIINAHALIITLGTNRCYSYSSNAGNIIVANCHKIPETQFTVNDISIEEITERFTDLLTRLFNLNTKLQVLFTVSPYRYSKYGFHASNLSKAVLLLSIDNIIKRFANKCFYFPSYEIVNDELRDYRFYADDMLHPSELAVNYIFERFAEYAFDRQAAEFALEWKKIIKAMKHRPLHPETKEYRGFLEKTRAHIVNLSKKYANLAVANELEILDKSLQQTYTA